jgi:hypothetical protein
MRSVTAEQTRQLINLTALLDEKSLTGYRGLIDKIKSSRVLLTARGMVGSLRWRGPSGPSSTQGYLPSLKTEWDFPDDFAGWILGKAGEPGEEAVMNCWEAVLFIAYKAGVITKAKITEIHEKAAGEGRRHNSITAAFRSIARSLYKGELKTFHYDKKTNQGTPHIPAGNIVFIQDYLHVMISKGSIKQPEGHHEVISLWLLPGYMPADVEIRGTYAPKDEDKKRVYNILRETTVEEIIKSAGIPGAKITFAEPAW